jgi:hypothetical protein
LNRRIQLVLCTTLLVLLSGLAGAQVINSGVQSVTLNANLSESISVNLSSNSVSFTLTSGSSSNAGSSGVTATTTWISKPGRNMTLYAYFASSSAALSDGAGNNIPSANFQISDNAGAYAALKNSVAFGGASAGLSLYTIKITGTNKTGNHADNMLFNIDLSTLPNLPAGTYAGTLNIQAQVI